MHQSAFIVLLVSVAKLITFSINSYTIIFMIKLIYFQAMLLIPALIYYLEVIFIGDMSYGVNTFKALHLLFFLTSIAVCLIGIKIVRDKSKTRTYASIMIKVTSIIFSIMAIFIIKWEFGIVYYMLKEFLYCLRYCFV